MNITDLLIPERVTCCHDVGSKKRLLEHTSELLASSSLLLSKNEIFDALISAVSEAEADIKAANMKDLN